MLMLLLLLFAIAHSLVPRTFVVKSDYRGDTTGWLTIKLARPGRIASVLWCSDLFAPIEGEQMRDINDCKAHNLIRFQIYPGNPNNYQFSQDGQTVRINPQSVKDFWSHKQADVVVHADMGDMMLEQVLRMNPINAVKSTAATTEGNGEKMAVTEQPTHHTHDTIAITTDTTQPVISTDSFSPVALIVTGCAGMFILFGTIALVITRNRSSSSSSNVADKKIDLLTSYEFEMVDMATHRQDDQEIQEKQEVIEFVATLGTGANRDFLPRVPESVF